MIIYGTTQCPDTMAFLQSCDAKGIPYEFRNISELPMLKEFLRYRDTSSLFDEVKARGGVGIPLVVEDDGSLVLKP